VNSSDWLMLLLIVGETAQEVAVKSSPCQTKLAALARDINCWEDDSSHTTIKCVMLIRSFNLLRCNARTFLHHSSVNWYQLLPGVMTLVHP